MTEPSNAVLSEQVQQLKQDFYYHKGVIRDKQNQMEKEIRIARDATNSLNLTMSYVNENVSDMKDSMDIFIKIQSEQTKSINDFISDDKRMNNKKQIILSALQVVLIIVGMVLGIWGYDQF